VHINTNIFGWLKRHSGLAEESRLQPPAEIMEYELGTPGPATTLPSPAEAAAMCGLGTLGTATILPPPVKAALAMHERGAANNPPRAEALPFNKAGSSLLPTGTKTTTNASLLSAGVVCGALGAPLGACAYFFSSKKCNRGPESWFSHARLTATQLRRGQRRKAGMLKHASRRGKKTACNSRKGNSFQEPTESKGFLSCQNTKLPTDEEGRRRDEEEEKKKGGMLRPTAATTVKRNELEQIQTQMTQKPMLRAEV
jgi:hypothetical protein